MSATAQKVYTGTVFYASQKAKFKRYVKEGKRYTVRAYHQAIEIEDNFVQIDLDDSGQNYIHLTMEEVA